MKRRTWASSSSASSPPSGRAGERTVLRRRPGAAHLPAAVLLEVGAWTSAGGRAYCASTTARRTRSGRRRTCCWIPVIADVDGNVEERTGTVSVFNGSDPALALLQSPEEEAGAVARLAERSRRPTVSCRTKSACSCAPRPSFPGRLEAVKRPAWSTRCWTNAGDPQRFRVGATMHYAKGLEFRAVAVMACEDEVIPLQSRLAEVADPGRPGRRLQHGALPALRGVHEGPGLSHDQQRRAAHGVPGRPRGAGRRVHEVKHSSDRRHAERDMLICRERKPRVT
jgi:hypothetical protein